MADKLPHPPASGKPPPYSRRKKETQRSLNGTQTATPRPPWNASTRLQSFHRMFYREQTRKGDPNLAKQSPPPFPQETAGFFSDQKRKRTVSLPNIRRPKTTDFFSRQRESHSCPTSPHKKVLANSLNRFPEPLKLPPCYLPPEKQLDVLGWLTGRNSADTKDIEESRQQIVTQRELSEIAHEQEKEKMKQKQDEWLKEQIEATRAELREWKERHSL